MKITKNFGNLLLSREVIVASKTRRKKNKPTKNNSKKFRN